MTKPPPNYMSAHSHNHRRHSARTLLGAMDDRPDQDAAGNSDDLHEEVRKIFFKLICCCKYRILLVHNEMVDVD